MWICILLKKKSVYSNHLFFIKSYEVCCKFDHWSGGCRGESCIDVIFFFFFFFAFFHHWCSKIMKYDTCWHLFLSSNMRKTLQNSHALLFHIDCLWFLTSDDSRWASVGKKHKHVCVTVVNATSWLRILIFIIIYCKLEMVQVILALGCC